MAMMAGFDVAKGTAAGRSLHVVQDATLILLATIRRSGELMQRQLNSARALDMERHPDRTQISVAHVEVWRRENHVFAWEHTLAKQNVPRTPLSYDDTIHS